MPQETCCEGSLVEFGLRAAVSLRAHTCEGFHVERARVRAEIIRISWGQTLQFVLKQSGLINGLVVEAVEKLTGGGGG